MRPRDNGETTLMVCCGEEIEYFLKVPPQKGNRTVAFAMWRCDECFTAYWQTLAEVHPEGANGETTSMICCGHEIECTLKTYQVGSRAVAVAMWRCNECFTIYWQTLAEVHTERAEAVVIKFQVVEPMKTIEEGKESREITFRLIKGGKDRSKSPEET